MGLWGFGKKVLNDTIGKSYMQPLDRLISAKLLCRGFEGNTFTITHNSGAYPPVFYELTANDMNVGQYKAVIIPLPLGAYTVKVDVGGTIINATANLSAMGVTYTLTYSTYEAIGTFYSNGSFTVPAGVTQIWVTAIGGGGAGGIGGHADPGNGGGGGGGGAGSFILQQPYNVTAGSTHAITVGKGGATNSADGFPGGSTSVGSLVTLSGGAGGSMGLAGISGGDYGGYGGAGGGAGGAGGKGGNSASTASGGANGSAASGAGGGSGGTGDGGGGGGGGAAGITSAGARSGGGRGGDGGNGERYTSAGAGGHGGAYGAGGGGGGGAGWRYQSYGNSGGGSDGFVRIFKGIVVS